MKYIIFQWLYQEHNSKPPTFLCLFNDINQFCHNQVLEISILKISTTCGRPYFHNTKCYLDLSNIPGATNSNFHFTKCYK